MNDLDVLRDTLRERESCAPDPDDVFAGVRRRLHRRQVRRRAAGVAAVVAMTAGGLVGGVAWWGADPGRTGAAAPPSTAEVPGFVATLTPPVLAVSLREPVPGFTQTAWTTVPGKGFEEASEGSLQLESPDGRTIVIAQHGGPAPATAGTGATTVSINGEPAPIRTLSPGGERELVLGSRSQQGWTGVLGSPTVSDETLVRAAEAMASNGGVADSVVRAIGVPASWRIVSWSEGAPGNVITLCPGASTGQDCAEVRTTQGKVPEVYDFVALPGTGTVQSQATPVRVPLDRRVRMDGVDLRTSADGRVAARQLDAGHWTVVRTETGQAGIVAHLAASLLYR